MQVLGAPTDLSTLESAISQLKNAVEAKPDSHIKSVQRGEVFPSSNGLTIPLNMVNADKCKVIFSVNVDYAPGDYYYSDIKIYFNYSLSSSELNILGDSQRFLKVGTSDKGVEKIVWELTEYA